MRVMRQMEAAEDFGLAVSPHFANYPCCQKGGASRHVSFESTPTSIFAIICQLLFKLMANHTNQR